MKISLVCALLWCAVTVGSIQAQISRTIYRSGIPVKDVAWSPDGARLAFFAGNKLMIWDVAADSMLTWLQDSMGSIYAIRWRPDGREIAYAGARAIGIWNPDLGTHHMLPVRYFPAKALSWSPDGRKIACATGVGNTMEDLIWDVAEEKILSVIDQSNLGYGCSVYQALWHPDGSQIVFSGSCGYYGDIFDPATGQIIGHLNPEYNNSGGHSSIISLSYSPDGRYLAAGSHTESIVVFDSKTWRDHRVIWLKKGPNAFGKVIVAWNPMQNILISGRDSGQIGAWDPLSRIKFNTFSGHDGAVTGLSWSPDGKRLASSGTDGDVKIWEGTTLLSAVDDISSQTGELRVYPNPARNDIKMEYRSAHAGTVRLSLVDVRGGTVLDKQHQSSGSGREELRADLSGIATGHYMILLHLPDGTSLRRNVEVVK